MDGRGEAMTKQDLNEVMIDAFDGKAPPIDAIWEYLQSQKAKQREVILQIMNKWEASSEFTAKWPSDTGSRLTPAARAELGDAINNALIPPMEEMDDGERRKLGMGALLRERDGLRAELAELKARVPRFLPGDRVWTLWGSDIRETILMALRNTDVDLRIIAKNQGEPVNYPGVSLSRIYATADECRAAIPVERLP